MVGALSCIPKGWGFNSWSGHMPGLWVWSPVRTHMNGNQSMFLSLPSSFSKSVNIFFKNIAVTFTDSPAGTAPDKRLYCGHSTESGGEMPCWESRGHTENRSSREQVLRSSDRRGQAVQPSRTQSQLRSPAPETSLPPAVLPLGSRALLILT